MVGYHYTSYKNWLKIKKVGLHPQLIMHKDILPILVAGTRGIWIWRKRHRGKANVGNVMRVAAVHNTSRVVLLKIYFKDRDIVRRWGQRVRIGHDATIENFVYHSADRDFAWLLNKIIDPVDIELIRDYDLKVLLK